MPDGRRVSSSSDDLIDTSDETIDLSPTGNVLLNKRFIAECTIDTGKRGKIAL